MEEDEENFQLPGIGELNDAFESVKLKEKRTKTSDAGVTHSDNIAIYVAEKHGMKPLQSHETFDWQTGSGEFRHVFARPGSKVAAFETAGSSAGKYSEESGSYTVDEAEMSKASGPVISVAGALRKNERTEFVVRDGDIELRRINFKTEKPALGAKVVLHDGREEDLSEYEVTKTRRITEFEGASELSYKQKVTMAELTHAKSGKKLTVVGRRAAADGKRFDYHRAWVMTEGGKPALQEDETSEILNRQMEEIDMWHSYRLDEHETPDVHLYNEGKKDKMDFTNMLKSEKEALAEQLRFTFSYAEKTDKGGIKIGDREYTSEELKSKYGELLGFAGIDLKKVKDVKKEVDGVMYG